LRPTLIVNPVTDRVFASVAERHVDDGVRSVETLEARLRHDYPRAVVHARELSSEAVTIWYVYRDGHWTSARPGG